MIDKIGLIRYDFVRKQPHHVCGQYFAEFECDDKASSIIPSFTDLSPAPASFDVNFSSPVGCSVVYGNDFCGCLANDAGGG